MSDRRADQLHAAALRALDELAENGDAVAGAAAGLLRARLHGAGRAFDDTAALAECRRIAAEGRERQAVGIVAMRMAAVESTSAESIGRRLRRKLKRLPAVSVSEKALERQDEAEPENQDRRCG